MKTKLLLLLALTFGLTLQAQTYELTLKFNGSYSFTVQAVPNFTSTSPHPFINDQNFTIIIPNGVTLSSTGAYSVPVFTAIDAYYPDHDAIPFNLVSDIPLPAHTAGTPIDIVTFNVDGSPTSGTIKLLGNTDGLVLAAPEQFASKFIGTLSGDLADPATDNYAGQTGTVEHSFATLGTVENELTGYSVFPNPATDVVTINGLDNELSKVEVYNITGQRVLTSTTNMETINVGAFNAGVYFVKLSTDVASTTIKLVKE